MASVLMVVGDSAAPTAGDAAIRTLLEGLGHTVTYRSDELAEDVTGQDLVVLAESSSSGTIDTKYRDVALPSICVENGAWPAHNYVVTGASMLSITSDNVDINDATHPIADGPHGTYSGNLTEIATVADGRRTDSGNLGAGVVVVGMEGSLAKCIIFAYDSGAAMANAATAPAKRAAFGQRDAMWDAALADLEGLFKNTVEWMVPAGTGTAHVETVTDAVGISDSAVENVPSLDWTWTRRVTLGV